MSFEIVNQPGLQTKPENWCFTEGCFFKRVEIQWEKRKFTRKIKISAIERPCKVNLDKEAVVNANKNLSQHPSIWKIKETTNFSACFSFHTVSKENILYQLHSLDPTKAMQKCDIPTNTMRKNYDIFSGFLFAKFNGIFWWQTLTSLFPEHLKYAGVKRAVTKDYRNDKNNYRPVSILSNISKIYERLFYKQLETYFESILSQYQCGLRKGFIVLTTLLPVIENREHHLTQLAILQHYWLICQKLSTVYPMTYLLLNFMHTD